jgi:hypothetical protein
MNEATQLIAEMQERLDKLKELIGEHPSEPKRLRPGDKAPAIEWLRELDEPLRSEALKAVKERPYLPYTNAINISDAIVLAFKWLTEDSKWDAIFRGLRSKGQ